MARRGLEKDADPIRHRDPSRVTSPSTRRRYRRILAGPPPSYCGLMSDMYDFIVKLRAIRQYSEGPVSRDDLEKILEAARWTGSSKNRQKWSFLVFTDREGLDGLARCGSFTQPLRDATAAIVLVQEPGGNMFDIGRAAQNIMLAAQAIGVASCPITLHKEDEVQDFLQPKSGQIARYAVALGYPTEDSKPANFGGRKEQQRLVRWL